MSLSLYLPLYLLSLVCRYPLLCSDELGIIFSVAPPTPAAQAEPIPDTGRKADAPPPGPSGSTAAAAAPDDDDSDGAAPAPEPQFILQEHKLGVSVHSVHPLINQARAALPAARREYRWLKQKACAGAGTCRGRDGGCREDGQDAARAAAAAAGREGDLGKTAVGATAAAVAAVEAAAAAVAAERLLSVTRALLLVNADHGSAWNARKEVVVDGLCEGASIPQEMKASLFCSGVLLRIMYTCSLDGWLIRYTRSLHRRVLGGVCVPTWVAWLLPSSFGWRLPRTARLLRVVDYKSVFA